MCQKLLFGPHFGPSPSLSHGRASCQRARVGCCPGTVFASESLQQVKALRGERKKGADKQAQAMPAEHAAGGEGAEVALE